MTTLNKIRQLTHGLFLLLLLMAGAAWGQSGKISSTNFGMQCGTGNPDNCPGFKLPMELAKPGFFRLWDSDTYWAVLQPQSRGSCQDFQQVGTTSYCWDNLDSWLDAIAVPNSYIRAVDYVFGGTPCQIVDATECGEGPPDDPNGLPAPPSDLTSSGSVNFNNFVYYLTQHCSPEPKHNCVANIIKYYEMWNEPNGGFWSANGTETQLAEMVFPARSYIRSNVTNAVVMTPGFAGANSNYSTWFQDWLNAENSNGTLSDAVAFHVYMASQTPETQYLCYIVATTSSSTCNSNENLPSFLYMKDHTTGWASKPWINTETNFNPDYTCTNSSTADCTGQVVRWQLLQDSSGATSVDWYYWNYTIGRNTSYDPAYYYMMQYLEGGKFTSTCSNAIEPAIWTCNFTDTNSNADLWVWTTSTTAQSYTPPNGYINYWTIAAGSNGLFCEPIPSSGFTVTVEPYLLVKTSCSIKP
jgi:hypothetical protein